jgi:rRNA maturation endonuclease Nob1
MTSESICENCGSIYKIRAIKIPVRDKDSLDCTVCGEELKRWNEAKMWTAELIERHEKHLQK